MDCVLDKLLRLRLATNFFSRFSMLSAYIFFGLMLISKIDGFNIDTEFPVRFQNQPNSFFGYSVAMLKNSQGNWVIVSAPKANASQPDGLNQPGQVYKCHIDYRNCTEIIFEFGGDKREIIDQQFRYDEIRSNGWLGVSLDTTAVNDGLLLACSHLWVNKIHEQNDYHLTNGMCYTIDKEFDPQTTAKLLPLIKTSEQVVLPNKDYKFAYAQAGISAQFIKDSDSLLLGAPGIYDWRGSGVFMSREDSGRLSKRSTLRHHSTRAVPNPIVDLEYTAYFGYAVTSGHFLNNGEVQYVFGAPRQNYKGKIYLVEIKFQMYDKKVDRTGEQMGEYFGSAVCAVDLDNDKLDDLLVGAPLHSKHSDEGKVYVFKNMGNTIFQLSAGLMGSSVPGARFGSSIAVIGDVNMDDYLDVAIGAPYENERGAVYVYHGSRDGLQLTPKHKILASDGSNLARGFGISIARGMDVDDNKYPDLVVGAYMSDETFVFRTKPLVYLKGSLVPDRGQINMDSKDCGLPNAKVSCFKLEACISYTGKFIPNAIDVMYAVEVDTLKGNDLNTVRVFIHTSSGEMQKITNNVTVNLDDPKCFNYEVYAKFIPRDYLTPIHVSFAYEMIPMQKSTTEFCKTCPIVDQSAPRKIIKQVRFQKHCGDDEKCDADLQLQASFLNFSTQTTLIIGSQTKMTVQTKLYNAGEPAYAAILSFDLPSWITVEQKQPSCDYTLNTVVGRNRLLCLVANPLQPKGEVNLDVILNLENVPLENGVVEINVTAITDSNEDPQKQHDNSVTLQFPVKMESDVYVIGSTLNEQAFYHTDAKGIVIENSTATFTHHYEVFNDGPSPVKYLTVVINYPFTDLNSDKPLLHISDVVKKDGSKSLFGSCEGQVINQLTSQGSGLPGADKELQSSLPTGLLEGEGELQQIRERRDTFDSIFQETDEQLTITNDSNVVPSINKDSFVLNCTTGRCATLTCYAGPFFKDTSAVLIVSYVVDVYDLQKIIGKKDSTVIFTEAQVIINNVKSDFQPKNHKSDFAKVATEVKSGGPPPPKEMAPWIIPVSVIGGILLLILLTVALIKLGFFRRKQKEEMERLKQNEQPVNQDGQSSASQDTALLQS